MSIREIGSWESATFTEKVAWIAKHVLHKQVDWKPGLSGAIVPFMLISNWSGMGMSAYVEISCPNPTDDWAYLTNPTADYEVLNAIRNIHGTEVYIRFAKELDIIYAKRAKGYIVRSARLADLCPSATYIVGDYSHAAFMALRSDAAA